MVWSLECANFVFNCMESVCKGFSCACDVGEVRSRREATPNNQSNALHRTAQPRTHQPAGMHIRMVTKEMTRVMSMSA